MAAKYLRRQTWWVRFYHPRTGALLRGSLEMPDAARAELLHQRVEFKVALLEPRFQAAELPPAIRKLVSDPSSGCVTTAPVVAVTPAEPLAPISQPETPLLRPVAKPGTTIDAALKAYLDFIRMETSSHRVAVKLSMMCRFFGSRRVEALTGRAVMWGQKSAKDQAPFFQGDFVDEITAVILQRFMEFASLKQQGAAITVWGVGTRLLTAYDQPALGGVYKLSAVRTKGGAWQHKIKLSEQAAKVSTPGLQQVRRFRHDGTFIGDMIYDLDGPVETGTVIVDRVDMTRRKYIPDGADYEDLLVPIFRGGRLVYEQPPIAAIRERTQTQLSGFHEGHKRFLNPHEYPVGLSPMLHGLRTQLILAARGEGATAAGGHP